VTEGEEGREGEEEEKGRRRVSEKVFLLALSVFKAFYSCVSC